MWSPLPLNILYKVNDFSILTRHLSHTVVPSPYVRCCFLRLHLPEDNQVGKSQMKNSRNKQFLNFKFRAILNSMMTSCAVLLSPTLDVNHLFVQCIPPLIT